MPEFPDDYYWSVEELEAEFEGNEHETAKQGSHWECDYCSKGVNVKGGYTAYMYLADDVLGDEYNQLIEHIRKERPLTPLASYDDDHAGFQRLLFPCEGFMEVRMVFECAEDRTIENAEVTDISPRDDGIPWDPEGATEKVMQIDFDEHARRLMYGSGDHLWGPENMITWMLGVGIDPREFINWDGSYDAKGLGRARKQHERFSRYYRKHASSKQDARKAFRDAVLDDDVIE